MNMFQDVGRCLDCNAARAMAEVCEKRGLAVGVGRSWVVAWRRFVRRGRSDYSWKISPTNMEASSKPESRFCC